MATTMKMADPNSNNSNLYIIPVSIVLPIALVLVIARLWSRVKRTKKLYIDDWLILVAEVRNSLTQLMRDKLLIDDSLCPLQMPV